MASRAVGKSAELIDLLEMTWGSLARLARRLTEDEWHLPTTCPGWDVQDHLAHVAGFEAALAGRPQNPHRLDAALRRGKDPFGVWVETHVDARRRRDPGELIDELEGLAGERTRQLREAAEVGDATPVPAAMGGTQPLIQMLPIRVADCWYHEQDIRRATGRGGHTSGPVPRRVLRQLLEAMPMVVARKVAAPEGAAVGFVVAGPTRARAAVQVRDGRGHTVDFDASDCDAVLRLSFDTFVALAGGRVDPGAALVAYEGDRRLGRRVTSAMAITP